MKVMALRDKDHNDIRALMKITGVRSVEQIETLVKEEYAYDQPGAGALAQLRLPEFAKWLQLEHQTGAASTRVETILRPRTDRARTEQEESASHPQTRKRRRRRRKTQARSETARLPNGTPASARRANRHGHGPSGPRRARCLSFQPVTLPASDLVLSDGVRAPQHPGTPLHRSAEHSVSPPRSDSERGERGGKRARLISPK